MEKQHQVEFQFLSEPSDINYGGKVHGGAVMKWIDQTGYSCASMWSESYAVTVYVGGIRFYKPILIGDMVRVHSRIIYTGNTSMHIAIDVYSKKVTDQKFEKKTHCVIVFVAIDENGKSKKVPTWKPETEQQKQDAEYAVKLMNLRKNIEQEMTPFLKD